MCKCFVCGKIVKDNDEFEWHGCDGDKIHASCKPNLDRAYDMINNMNDNEFINSHIVIICFIIHHPCYCPIPLFFIM